MILIPIRTERGQNAREHWRVRAKRVKREREDTAWFLRGKAKPSIPCTVLLTRCAPSNGLDDDNLAGALKSVRDEISVWLGVDDKLRDVVRYTYAQERTGRGDWGVRIEFGEPVRGAQLQLTTEEA